MPQELVQLEFCEVPVCNIELVKEKSYVFYGTDKVTNPEKAYDIIKRHLHSQLDREHFVVMYLNTKNFVLGINTASIGTLNASLIHPRELFKAAILANAAHIILAHNHPTGITEPSEEDLLATQRIEDAGEILGIQVLDHLILGHDCFMSLRESGLMVNKEG